MSRLGTSTGPPVALKTDAGNDKANAAARGSSNGTSTTASVNVVA